MNGLLKLVAITCLISGCQTPQATSASSSPPNESLVYEQGPCFGFCPVYRFEVQRDGQYVYIGERHTQQTGRLTVCGSNHFSSKRKSCSRSINQSSPCRCRSVSIVLIANCTRPITVTFASATNTKMHPGLCIMIWAVTNSINAKPCWSWNSKSNGYYRSIAGSIRSINNSCPLKEKT